MEKRAILAAALMVALLMVYQYFFVPHPPEQARPGTSQPVQGGPSSERTAAPAPENAPATGAVSIPQAPPPPPTGGAATQGAETLRVESPLYHLVVSSAGGRFEDWTLKYRGEKPWVTGRVDSRGLVVVRSGDSAGQPVAMRFIDKTVNLTDGTDRDVKLSGEDGALQVLEKIEFPKDAYSADVTVRVLNRSREPRTVTVALPWDAPQAWKDTKESFPGQHPNELVWSEGGKVHRIANLCDTPAHSGDGKWVALGSGGYMVALMPNSGGFGIATSGEEKKVCDAPAKGPVGRATIALQATPTIAPGQAWEGHATVYVGPKEYDRLKALGLDGAIHWGCFPIWCQWGGLPMEWLGVPILKVMNWVYHYVGNYGVAIILLTVISKVLFFPLTVKSMRSMKAMQALQPQINTLRNKYRSDPRKLQEETMALYRKHKVNPMGGCLPMVAQIPIFYALYAVLTVSAELQSAPFLCFGTLPAWVPGLGGHSVWICDLANVDPTYILPVLMAVTMFIQQKMSPTAADPQQAKMMLMMPLMFGGMFIVFPIASGLTLYWTVSNILQIVQQRWLDRGTRGQAAQKSTKAVARA
jgi:YidC/Oxa1 family membrane protein insertase